MASPTTPVVVITGATAGVGRATARAFAERGAKIALLARGRAGLDAARRDVDARGGQAITLRTDVADPDDVEAAAAVVEERFGPIDVWVNNAMTSVFAPFKQIEPEEFRRVTEVTYLGVVYGTMAALRHMLPRDRGTIIQVGSALAYRSIPLQSAYCGAKHAIVGFTDSIRSELLHDGSGVQLTVVHLPAMNTPQFGWVKSRLPHKAQPVPPIYQPELAADAILWATEHRRREVLIGGNTNVIVWANKFFPGLGDRYLARTGFEGQQYDGRREPERPSNLFEPVDDDRDHGAHGAFDERAKTTSRSWEVGKRAGRALLLGGVGVLVGTVVAGAIGSARALQRSDDGREIHDRHQH